MATSTTSTTVVPDLQIELLRSSIVAPAQPVPNSTLFLSNIDQEAMYKVESVYFFTKSPENVADVIESALSKTLVHYHFLAGRFRLNPTEQRVEVNCNGEGVLFVAAASKLALSELGDLSNPNPAFRILLAQPSDSLGLFETPMATYQVTRFKCGGFVLGMTIFHSLMDGIAITDFLRNLGSITRGEGLLLQPNPNREFLKARSPPQPQYYEQSMCRVFRVTKFADIPLLPFNPTLTSINNSAPTKHVFKSFPVTGQMLQDLKAESLRDGDLAKCSSFESIAAHVLQQVARSRSGSLDPNSLVSMFIAVDFTRKLIPTVDRNFCGNAILTACVAATAEELQTKSLGYLTVKIQEALNEINDEYVRSWTDFWEVNRIGPARIPMSACFSGWWKLPFYDLDFGWGKPFYSGPVPNQLVAFIVLLASGKNDGGANVYISLEPEDMAAFEKNLYAKEHASFSASSV